MEIIGRTLGRFKIIGSLGAGGMGQVYRARDEQLGQEVAVKVLPAEFATDPERLHRFEQEARGAAASE
jgi:eukaryotic-like serine/threonine-protein kinase